MYVFFNIQSESEIYFCQPEPKTLYNTEKIKFMDYREFAVPVDENGYRI